MYTPYSFPKDTFYDFTWPEGHLSPHLEEFVMTVHVFEAVSSPSVANFALQSTAKDMGEKFDSEATATLESVYIDYLLKCFKTSSVAVVGVKNVVQLSATGEFRLNKIVSNSREVMATISPEERGKTLKEIDLDSEVLPVERTLGVLLYLLYWCIENDSFGFRIVMNDQPLTRKVILSTVRSVYDPLWLAAPFLLKGKLILQQFCMNKKGWDEKLNEYQISAWEK